jgi:hypothetical protein
MPLKVQTIQRLQMNAWGTRSMRRNHSQIPAAGQRMSKQPPGTIPENKHKVKVRNGNEST